MSYLSTPLLSVERVRYSAVTGKLTLFIARPPAPPLYLDTIVIGRNGAGPMSSSISVGDLHHPGKAQILVSDRTFDDLSAQLVVPCSVVLTYQAEGEKEVVGFDVSRNLAALSNDLVHALRKALGNQNEAEAAE